MNMIERDIYVLSNMTAVSIPIDYVQGSNLIPIKFNIVDYDLPAEATAKVYVKKPSTKAEFDTATIDGNSVIIDVKDTMFTEKDTHFIQVLISKDDKTLVTFEYPVRVGRNNVTGELPKSENRSNFLDDYLGRIDQRIDDTETRLGQSLEEVVAAKNTAIENANIAVNNAQETEADRQETEQNAAVAKSYAEQARKLVESVPSWAKQPAPDNTLTQSGQAADAKAVGDVRGQVSGLKSDIAYLGNTGEIKVGSGKVLTATDDGTEWKKLDEKWELVESITFSESVTTVIKTFEHEYKKISILTSVGGAEWHYFYYIVEGGNVGQVFNTIKRYRYILAETFGDTIKSILSEYNQTYATSDVNINQNIRSGRNIKGFKWDNCKFEAGVTMQIKGVRA